jgi:trans-aconitate methyltransferase
VTPAWDPQTYQDKHSFVWQFGAALLELLEPRAGERILDVGCGTGQLTAEIARSGAEVIGLDKSPEMLADAHRNFPELRFEQGDASDFRFAEKFDAVFSNAALHWVRDHAGAAKSMAGALKPGGRLVAELGGKGCIASVIEALRDVLGSRADERCPWRFPSIGEFTPLLELSGLEVQQAFLFDRPTPLDGAYGLENWLHMFAGVFFQGLSDRESRDARAAIGERLHPKLFHDGVWTLDYRRLRIVARNPA